MMHFPSRDGDCLAELREMTVVTPTILDQIDARLGRREGGTLNEFLLCGADLIPEGPWLAWLIRRHNCHRFGRVKWTEAMTAIDKNGPLGDGNLPYRLCADGSLLLAVMRPDLLQSAQDGWKARAIHFAAATLVEMRALHAAWGMSAA